MIRILAIPTPFRYVNPTWDLLIDRLSELGVVEIFGPRNGRECSSIRKLFRDHGKFDVILCDPWFFVENSSAPKRFKPFDFEEVGVPIIVSLMQYDLHNLSRAFIEDIAGRASMAISVSSGYEFFYTPEEKDYKNEPWLKPGSYSLSSSRILNSRFSLFPHCIALSEFSELLGSRKESDVIVPGVQYHFRRLARDFLTENGDFSIGTERDLVQRFLGRLSTTNIFGNSLYLRKVPRMLGLYQRRFRDAIRRSHVAVTCDGSIGYPIRKFFEIPAAGTILAAKFFTQPERLGFFPGENCYSITEENLVDLIDIVNMARSDSSEARRVCGLGQTMVHDLHTVDVRAHQLLNLCEAVAGGNANAVSWQEGRPVFQKVEVSA